MKSLSVMLGLALSSWLTLFLVSCETINSAIETDDTIKKADESIKIHPTRHLKFWPPPAKLVSQRVHPASADLVDLSRISNTFYRDSVKANAIDPSTDLSKRTMRETAAALDALPASVKKVLEPRLQGIYLIQNLGSTAMTYGIFDESNRAKKSIILLDVDAVNRTANEWAAWKESTAFQGGPNTLQVTIEESKDNNSQQTIQFILLHEIGHVIASALEILPEPGQEFVDRHKNYPFLNLSWKFDDASEAVISDEKTSHTELRNVVFYTESGRKPNDSMIETYTQLKESSFFSLYGSSNLHDDFAEAFAIYVHSVLMQKPWNLEVISEGKSVLSFSPCIEDKRCQEKVKFLQNIFVPENKAIKDPGEKSAGMKADPK